MATLAAVAALASTLAVAAATPIVVRDDRGAAVAFAAPPQRIVSLLPSLTETVCALGACERLVGTDRFSNWPPPVATLPKLGGIDDAQVERIVTLRPDVVLLATSAARVAGRLESLGLKVLVLKSDDHADVQRSVAALAQLLDAPEAAVRLRAQIERELGDAARRVPASLRGRRVYFEVDTAPYAAGAGSFIGETLARLGLTNAVPPALGPFPKLNPEAVVRWQPDLVMASRAALDEMPARPGWAALVALRHGRSCGFAPDRYELLLRPGPRLGEAAGAIADCLVAIDRHDAAAKARR